MAHLSIFDILVYIAATTFALGWLVLIVDAISGLRLIEKLPVRIVEALKVIHNTTWASIGVILLAAAIVWMSGV